MSNQSRLKRPLYRVISFLAVAGFTLAAKPLYRVIWRSITAPKIVDAIHTTFPNFCKDGQILAETNIDTLETIFTNYNNHFWSIRCDSWLQYSNDIHLAATVLDLDRCMTTDPFFLQ